MRDVRFVIQAAALGVMLALAACQAAPPVPQPSVEPPAASQPTTSQPTASQPAASQPAPAEAVPSEPPPTLAPTAAAVRTALEATDPTTVVLASGRPTLVEFFAFW